MKNLRLKSNISDAGQEILKFIWDFIYERISPPEFEQLVYDHEVGLLSILTDESVEYLIEFPYRHGDTHELRYNLRKVFQGISSRCECVKYPEEFPFNQRLMFDFSEDCIEAMEYVENIFTKNMRLISEDKSIEGYWNWYHNEIKHEDEYFHEGKYYQCNNCEQCWLIILNETDPVYLLKRVFKDEIGNKVESLCGYKKKKE